ncbi:hypothetical protein [Asticcacaulis biprosthecium]|uniref:hypothetical protein n=1 Tax=Asticcacaulis biprosthecium TaxID=76891 RepID=UPI0009FD8F0C|nr:hypothetical protein [Asticcacaulis biprosthecium]
MRNLLSFDIKRHDDDGAIVITPCVDGHRLSDAVTGFERDCGMTDPAGGYDGLVPAFFQCGALEPYFLGQSVAPYFAGKPGHISVLACECGELGCWPLNCAVRLTGDLVTWHRFEQPHRPKRDYSSFGPFVFNLEPYRQTLQALQAQLG